MCDFCYSGTTKHCDCAQSSFAVLPLRAKETDFFKSVGVIPDPINHPLHYTKGKAKCSCGRTIECIDIVRHLGFNLGNAIKYIWRCDLKGNSTEDLKKAVFYLNDEIQKRRGGK